MESLNSLAVKYGSDKWGSHYYTQHYEKFFERFRPFPTKLFEIGVGGYDNPELGGASLRMWKEFFPLGDIVALDFHDKHLLEEDRIKIYRGSQADISVLSKIVGESPEGFDIIIDDGSHYNEHVIKSFWCLWPHVKAGGIYVVEDIQTSYWSGYGGDLYGTNNPHTSVSFFKSLVDGLNWQERHIPSYGASDFDRTIVGIHFYHNMVFIEKGSNSEGSNFIRSNVNPDVQNALLSKDNEN